MERILITEDILLKNGFIYFLTKDSEKEAYEEIWGLDEFKMYTICTNEENFIKIDMMYKCTNNGAEWHMHLDNDNCESIGSADISYIDQFNKMMEIFDSSFRIYK